MPSRSDRQATSVLHPVFALTGVLHAIGGALLPSLAVAFHMSDSHSGTLFFLYFVGTALGGILCFGPYARLMYSGFLLAAAACFAIGLGRGILLQPLFLFLGIGVGLPMTAISMYAGRRFTHRSAAPLTFLNFSWSIGALTAPLLAARVLVHHSYRAAYATLGILALVAAVACWSFVDEPEEPPAQHTRGLRHNLAWIALFALLTFLEVGVENTTATWLATFSARTAETGAALAAATSSLYWCGFLASRGLFSLLLLRINPARVLGGAVAAAVLASALLVGLSGPVVHDAAMFALGAALAPVFPLLLARFFQFARNTSDSRWVLSTCGFGGSVLPWLTGYVSSSTHSLRIGLATVPAALLLILCALPSLNRSAIRSSVQN